MKIRIFVCLLMSFAGLTNTIDAQTDDMANAQHFMLGQLLTPEQAASSVSNTHPDAQWFPKAGLGLFIHLGIASVHGNADLSWSMLVNKSWDDREIPPYEYWKFADVWNPSKFKPARFVKQAKKAGFKYIVLTTKHHDGYTMWPSQYGELGVKQKLKGRDIVREFVDACHKNDMKVGLYFSPPDWYFDREYKNWDYSGKQFIDAHHHKLSKIPEKPADHDKKRQEMVANQVRELLTNYGRIDLMWFDAGRGEISNAEIRRLQPGIVINRRNGERGDYGDSEGKLPQKRFRGWFETNDPCWPSRRWGYSVSDRMDTADDVIEKLVLLRAWGGNFLANVGPKPDGSMPEEAIKAWKEIGKWMKHSGESVYDVQGGSYPEKAEQPVTLKGDSIMYIHIFPDFHKMVFVRNVSSKPIKAVLLRTGKEVPFFYDDNILKLDVPPSERTRHVDTVKLVW